MTTSDIQLLRFYIDDPASESETFTSAQLQDFIDRFGDLHSAAAELWSIKAATVSEWYLTNTDGALLNRGEVFKHCKEMVDHHRSVSSESMISVDLNTRDPASTSSEF